VTDRPTAIVLAAGSGSRFGGGKLLAMLGGKPILRHVLDALADGGIGDPVVVVGPGGELDRGMEWGNARMVVNADPGRGLSSSLQVGWAEAMAVSPAPDSLIVVLGDQPLLDPSVVRALVEAPADGSRPVVVGRHADGARNPVRLEPEAAALVARAEGDRGLGPLLDANPELVRTLDVEASNPDIDRPADLVKLVEARWSERVRANAVQVDRFREVADGRDFYATVTRTFVADPAREDDPVLTALLAIARRDDTWLDVGAGAGRYALPLARHVREVIAVDPSSSMLAALADGARSHGIPNVRVHEGRWPPDRELRGRLGPDPVADVALIAHVGYDIEAIGAFLDALEESARRSCVAVFMEQSPASGAAPFWPLVHGEARVALPALPDFLELLAARGARWTMTMVTGEPRRWTDRDELLPFLRRQLWTAPGTAADGRLLEAVERRVRPAQGGGLAIIGSPKLDIGVVEWPPAG
jgi:molybdenum cofactor cytidylyltransferase